MRAFTILSLTHSDDFDGIGSQAIIYRYFSILRCPIPMDFHDKPDVPVVLNLFQSDYQDYLFYWAAIISGFQQKRFLKPIDFESLWKSIYLELHNVQSDEELLRNFSMVSDAAKELILDKASFWKTIDLIIISDIGYNKVFNSLLPFVEKLSIPLVYFDHHKHSESSLKFYKKHSKKQIIDTSRCGTQILHEFFLPNDEISKFISDLGADTDYGRYTMPESKEIMSVISYYRKDWDKLNDIVEKYATGKFFDEKLKQKYHKIKIWEDSEFRELKKTLLLTKYKFPNGEVIHFIIGVSNLRAGRSMNRLEEFLKRSQTQFSNVINSNEVVILLTIDRTELNSNIRSKNKNIHEIAVHFGGGGHIDRAGFRFPPSLIPKDKRNEFVPADINLEQFFLQITAVL